MYRIRRSGCRGATIRGRRTWRGGLGFIRVAEIMPGQTVCVLMENRYAATVELKPARVATIASVSADRRTTIPVQVPLEPMNTRPPPVGVTASTIGVAILTCHRVLPVAESIAVVHPYANAEPATGRPINPKIAPEHTPAAVPSN